MNDVLVFKKVGYINGKHPYICVYFECDSDPFMEIDVNDDKELQFTLYARGGSVTLNAEKWGEIFIRGKEFLPRAISDEDASL